MFLTFRKFIFFNNLSLKFVESHVKCRKISFFGLIFIFLLSVFYTNNMHFLYFRVMCVGILQIIRDRIVFYDFWFGSYGQFCVSALRHCPPKLLSGFT